MKKLIVVAFLVLLTFPSTVAAPGCPTQTPTNTSTSTPTPTPTPTVPSPLPTPTLVPTLTSTPTPTPTPTNTPTPTPTPTSTPTSTPTPTPHPVLPQIYAPDIELNYGTLPGPDLVVWAITAYTQSLQVIIRNVGDTATTESFWVDTYLNPDPVPDRVNQTWDQVSEYGMAHGVTAVPMDVLILEMGDEYYWPEYSNWEFPLAVGDLVCVQVDSANTNDPVFGAVIESHEPAGAYNNVTCSSVKMQ